MSLKRSICRCIAVASLAIGAFACGQTAAKFQSDHRPLGLDLWDPTKGQIMEAGSDLKSALVLARDFPIFNAFVDENLMELRNFAAISNRGLSADKIYFFEDYAPRIYLLHDWAAFANSVVVNIGDAAPSTPGVANPGVPFIAIPIAKTEMGLWGNGSLKRSKERPCVRGDFVQLPTVRRGQQLELRNISFAPSEYPPKPNSIWHYAFTIYNRGELNVNQKPMIVMFLLPGSDLLCFAIEDDPSSWGDDDYNDVIFLIDVGPKNAAALRNTAVALPR